MWEYPQMPYVDATPFWPEIPIGARNGDVFRVIDGELFKIEDGRGPFVEGLEE